jgi:competence protein ComEA
VPDRSACRLSSAMASRSLFTWIVIPIAAAMLAPANSAQSDAARPPSSSRFPAGPGRDALFHVCGNCHGPESVLGHLKTHDEWSKILDEMANNGAQGSDEEWTQILAYLDQHYSLIFINKATAKDLETTLDVAPAVAAAIVRRRTEHGPYTSIDDLTQVPGVAAATIEARKDRLIF